MWADLGGQGRPGLWRGGGSGQLAATRSADRRMGQGQAGQQAEPAGAHTGLPGREGLAPLAWAEGASQPGQGQDVPGPWRTCEGPRQVPCA